MRAAAAAVLGRKRQIPEQAVRRLDAKVALALRNPAALLPHCGLQSAVDVVHLQALAAKDRKHLRDRALPAAHVAHFVNPLSAAR